MPRTFAYVRVSTMQQTIENQVQELETAGFTIPKHRIICETISGSVPAQLRPMFARLIDRLEEGAVLAFTDTPGGAGQANRAEDAYWLA